jgi:hypothetical protein
MQTVPGKKPTFHFHVSNSPKKQLTGATGADNPMSVPVKTTAQVTPAPYGWDSTLPGAPANQLFNAAVILLAFLALIKLFQKSRRSIDRDRGQRPAAQ